jgi:hypothetical protein
MCASVPDAEQRPASYSIIRVIARVIDHSVNDTVNDTVMTTYENKCSIFQKINFTRRLEGNGVDLRREAFPAGGDVRTADLRFVRMWSWLMHQLHHMILPVHNYAVITAAPHLF